MNKQIVILMGNPDAETLSNTVADTYQSEAELAGHAVVRFNLGDLQFDPILHHGRRELQPLEPALQHVQDAIAHCDHLVVVYPNWWCAMPALLKGFFDRLWQPEFAFTDDGKRIQPLLSGKTARVFVLTGNHSPLMTWWKYGDFTNEIQHAILGLAGFKASVTVFGPTLGVTDSQVRNWKKQVSIYAARAQ